MKQAKLGAVFMVAVMALAGCGIAYAHWYDYVIIQVKADMGTLGFGFVDQWTDDLGPNYIDGGQLYPNPEGLVNGHFDPDCPEGENRTCGTFYPPAEVPKNVASTNCEMLEEKYWHDGTPMMHLNDTCYDRIVVNLSNVYPNYAPNLVFWIANAGCVPIDIVGHWLIDDGIPGNGFADGIDYPATWFFMYKCNMYQIDLSGDGCPDIEVGLFCLEDDQQIDPCDTDTYGISFHILQCYPQCHTYQFEFKLYGVQWNWPIIPPYTPTVPPLPPVP